MLDKQVVKKHEVYATIDQRLQGDDDFVDRVLEKHDGEIKKERKKKEYSLPEICAAARQCTNVSLEQLRSSSKEQFIMFGRRLVTVTARAYGYKGTDIAKYLQKEPSSVTKYAGGKVSGQTWKKRVIYW